MDRRIITLLFSLALLSGCSPLVRKIGEADTNSGYVKSLEFGVEKRLSRNVAHEGKVSTNSSEPVSAEVISINESTVRVIATGSEKLKENDTLYYTLTTSYEWPVIGVARKKQLEGEIAVTNAAKLSVDQTDVCIELGQENSQSVQLTPPPIYDSLSLRTSLTGAQLDIESSPQKDSISLYTIQAKGIELGNTTVTVGVGRDRIEPIALAYKTVASSSPPSGLRTRALQPGDNATPPPDVDHDTSKPIVLVWDKKIGSLRFAVQIFNPNGSRAMGALLNGDIQKYVAWLPSGDYSWRIRSEVLTCAGDRAWTPFSDKKPMKVQ